MSERRCPSSWRTWPHRPIRKRSSSSPSRESGWPRRATPDDIHHEGMQPLSEVLASLLENGGQVWACGACTKPRGITEADLIDGARIISAADVVAELIDGTPLYTC